MIILSNFLQLVDFLAAEVWIKDSVLMGTRAARPTFMLVIALAQHSEMSRSTSNVAGPYKRH